MDDVVAVGPSGGRGRALTHEEGGHQQCLMVLDGCEVVLELVHGVAVGANELSSEGHADVDVQVGL